MSLFFPHTFSKNNSIHWFAGVSVSVNCRRIETALIGIHGYGSGAPVEIRKTVSFDIPAEITKSFNELQEIVQKKSKEIKIPIPLLQHMIQELASVEEEAVDELLSESRLSRNDIAAVGISDPGLRCETPNGLFYQSICDAAFLAEQTGLNIVDAFPLQDIAVHGKGGPVFPMPAWVFLKSETQDRILLDLGRTARMMFLPRAEDAFSHQRIRYQDIIPCGSLLDALANEITGGKITTDIGGKMTVQGCRSEEILSNLRLLPLPLENWNPNGISTEPYLKVLTSQPDSQYSGSDVLCSASCFIAEKIVDSIQGVMTETSIDENNTNRTELEIIITGNCRLHGMLMNSITTLLGRQPLKIITQLGIPSETFDALCTAMLSVMAVSHIPSSLPHLTGGDATKTLGRITPGSIMHWQRLVEEMSQNKPAVRTLRSAI